MIGKLNLRGWHQERCPGRDDTLGPRGWKELGDSAPSEGDSMCGGSQSDTYEEAKEGQRGGSSRNKRKNDTRGGWIGGWGHAETLRFYSSTVECTQILYSRMLWKKLNLGIMWFVLLKVALDGEWTEWEQSGSQETTEVIGLIYTVGYLGSMVVWTGELGAGGFEEYVEDGIDRDWSWTRYEDERKERVGMTLGFMAWTTDRWGWEEEGILEKDGRILWCQWAI